MKLNDILMADSLVCKICFDFMAKIKFEFHYSLSFLWTKVILYKYIFYCHIYQIEEAFLFHL